MKREQLLIKNTFIITIGKICTQLVTFLLLPLYTTLLSTEEYGIVDLLNTLVSLLFPIMTLQIEQAIFRELIDNRNDNEENAKIISTGIITVTLQCILYLIIFAILYPYITSEYKLYLFLNVITYIFLSLLQQIARGFGNNFIYTMGSVISALSTILFNIYFLIVMHWKVTGMLAGTMLGQIVGIIFLFVSLKLYKYIKLKYYKSLLILKLLKYSIPLVPNALSWWIFNASDKVIVSAFLGLSANGILSIAHKFSTVFILIYNIFNTSWIESISLHINDKDIVNYFNKVFNFSLKIFVIIALIILSSMPILYPLMVNEKFNYGYYLIPILVIASIFNIIVGLLSSVYIANKNTKAIASTSIISAIINIIVHLILIKYIGLFAAVISTFVSFAIMSIYRYHDINKRYFKIKIESKFIFESFTIFILIIIIYYLKNIFLALFIFIVLLLYTFVHFKKYIKYALNTLERRKK